MSIDWSATGQMLSGIGTISGAVAVIIVALVGRNAWKETRAQRQAERQMEHAEKILASAYILKSAYEAIRSPLSTAHELELSEEELAEKGMLDAMSDAEKKRVVQANVTFVRSRHFDDDFSEAQKLVPYAAAFFGGEVRSSLEALVRSRHTVTVYAQAYAQDYGKDKDFDKKIRATIWKGYSVEGDDEITESINQSIERLEEQLVPIIRLPSQQSKSIETLKESNG